MDSIGMALVGAGYWGPNLARNIVLEPEARLRWVCDLSPARAGLVADAHAGASATTSLDEVLADDAVDAVVIATPLSTHAPLALACLRAGKHVLVEKPLAGSVNEVEEILAVAAEGKRVVMCDHTYCHTPTVRHIAGLVDEGTLGEIWWVTSVRGNPGPVQSDIDVIWDLAPHDLSILDVILPAEFAVRTVAASGADPAGTGRPTVGSLTLGLGDGAVGNVHLNWLSPRKIRRMIIGGSRQLLVWDDLRANQRVSRHGVGDVTSPVFDDGEPLGSVIRELVASIREDREPATGGSSGLRVLQVLEAASASLGLGGVTVPVVGARAAASS